MNYFDDVKRGGGCVLIWTKVPKCLILVCKISHLVRSGYPVSPVAKNNSSDGRSGSDVKAVLVLRVCFNKYSFIYSVQI